MTDDLTKTLNGDETPHQQLMRRFDELDARLASLEAKVDDRLRETRPIWERALAEILNLTEQVKETNLRLAEMKDGFEIVGGELLAVKTKQKHLETRMRAIEDSQQPQ